MSESSARLATIIGAHLREWAPSPPFVELAIFDIADADTIAQILDRFCRRNLGSAVARGLFHQSSIGSVTGLILEDERSVVIKAHQPGRSHKWLAEVVRVQSYLAERRVFATKVIAGPLPLGRGHAIVERFSDIGCKADAHKPAIRRALAAGLNTIIRSCAPLVETTSLRPILLTPNDTLWPIPHSKLFDFAASTAGAEWIDDIAKRAKERMTPVGRLIIGHGDWRAEHVRFVDNAAVAAFDWDSLCCEREPALVGAAAHGFCADWSRVDHRQAPRLAEARDFVGEYELARGKTFSSEERRLCGACFAYASAYTARCSHSAGGDARQTPDTFQHLLWNERDNLLDL